MTKPNQNVALDRQHWILVLAFVGMVALSIAFWILSLKGFDDVDQTWQEYSNHNVQMTVGLAEVRSHWGYGGFIHNFKNLVLRRDLAKYQPLIEHDRQQLTAALAKLQHTFPEPQNQQAIALLIQTFGEYQQSYLKTVQLIPTGASVTDIDAQVRVNDFSALDALKLLDAHINSTRQTMRTALEIQNSRALRFLILGALLLIPAIVVVAALSLSFLRRLMAARKVALQAQTHLANLFHSTPDPMLVLWPNGHIEHCNQMAVSFFGYDEAILLQKTLADLLDLPPGQHFPSYYFKQLQNPGPDGRTVITALTSEKQRRMVAATMSAAELETGVSITLMLRDVTQQLEDRQALVAAKTQAELALLRQKEIQDELVKSEKLASLSKLVAGVAHEINTPVGIMLTASSLLRDETYGHNMLLQSKKITKSQLSDYFTLATESSSLICNSCLRAAELIQSFKQVAVDQSSAERRCFNVADYIHEVIVSLRSCWKNTNINVTVQCPPDIEMDSYPGSFAQVLTNLVLNAVNHAFEPGEAGQITISVCRHSAIANLIEMQISDNGHGIADEHLDKVFEPFFTTKRNDGGTGLGLHIVHSAVEMVLGGKISLQSSAGAGCCFSVLLPLDVSANAEHIFNSDHRMNGPSDDSQLVDEI